jgi:hypothetical protein
MDPAWCAGLTAGSSAGRIEARIGVRIAAGARPVVEAATFLEADSFFNF